LFTVVLMFALHGFLMFSHFNGYGRHCGATLRTTAWHNCVLADFMCVCVRMCMLCVRSSCLHD
jgi:hypothetical protein